MKTVAAHDRPREKLQRIGASALGDNELLATVLCHGRASASALDLANAVLGTVGGLERLARARFDELSQCRESARRGPHRSSRPSNWAGAR